MQSTFNKGHAEVAPPLANSKESWYLPLFGVYHTKKHKIRVMFDSSASHNGVSLNDLLMAGPDVTNSLVRILLTFRRKAIAVIADIEQMFYAFHVEQDHRNFLRFLWHKDNDLSKELIEFRMCVHVFGNKPSPAVATYGLRKSIETQEPSVQEFVHRNFYVDDGLASFSMPEEAIDVMNKKNKKNALKSGGNLRLHKIASNSQQVMDAFNNEDLASSLKDLDLRKDEALLQHSLGLWWDVSTDTFTFEISQEDKIFTKRGVLSVINSVFDPLGFLAPVIIQGRILMRDIMSKTLEWDEPIPEPARSTWTEWKSSLKDLDILSVPRTIIQGSLSSCQNVSLHIFVMRQKLL